MRNSYALLLLVLLLTGFSCTNKKIELPPASFSRYIAGFTYGVVSVRSAFEIELQEAYVGPEKVGEEIKTALFDISPKVEGKTILKTPNRIIFIPNKPLEADQAYIIEFALHKALSAVDSKHEILQYTLRTIAASAEFIDKGLDIVSESMHEKVYDYQGMIKTSDVVDDKELESKVHIGTSEKVQWSHSIDGLEHTFTIKNIVAQSTAQRYAVEIDLENVQTATEDRVIHIPAKQDFTVTSITSDPDKNNQITVVFSESLSTTENDGMCSIQGQFDHSVDIVRNRMLINASHISHYGDVNVKILAGVKSKFGKKLSKEAERIVSFGSLLPSAQFVGDGNIVVDNKGVDIPIKTVGLHQINIEVYKIFQSNVLYFLQNNSLEETYNIKRFGRKVYGRIHQLNRLPGFQPNTAYNYNLDVSELVKMEKGAIYQVRLSFDKSMTAQYADPKKKEDANMFHFSLFQDNRDEEDEDSDYEYYYPKDYDYEKRDDPSDNSYYNYERFSKKNFLISNVGLIAKKGTDQKVYATCIDLLTAKPLSGAMVDVYSYQFQKIGQSATDGDGFATIDASEKPYFVVASHKGQKSYIKLENYTAQSVDVFDVEGNSTQKGLKCFVYGERGVWRPGDKLYLTMLLSNGYNDLPSDLPCQLELINPSGQVMDRMQVTHNVNGFYSFTAKTSIDAPTGNWIARFKVGGLKYDKIVKIETIKPNRLRIVHESNSEFIQNGDKIKYQTSWLNGAVSSGLKATVDMNFYHAPTAFNGFYTYTFTDNTKAFKPFEQSMYAGSTAADGSFEFTFQMQADPQGIPGMMQAVSTTKVFEPTGEFSIQYDTKKFSFFNSYVGHKIGTQGQYTLDCDKPYNIDIVNLNGTGQWLPNNKVKVEIYKVEYNWWYNNYNSTHYFDQENIKAIVLEKEIDVVNGKAQLPIRMHRNSWGNYLIKITDLTSQHSSSSFVYFESPYYEGRRDASAQVIQMSKDKESYKVGETAKLSMVSFFEGRALLSIENGREVLKAQWYDIKQGKNEISFKVENTMSPNVYAYVSAIQPQPNTHNNLPIRAFGITPIYVDNSSSILKPQITVPAKIQPESKLTIKVSEAQGQAMTYTLAVVDEGLLGISGFKNPDPRKFFYSKEALGVLTWDIFDKVIGVFTGVFRDVFSIGGGEDEINPINKAKSNRFNSVVHYLGPFELKGTSNTHTVDIPNYLGNLKVTVVAAGKGYRFGSTSKDVQVSKPLMVLGTLPRVLSIEEDIELPINLFAMEAGIKNVQLQIVTDAKIQVVGSPRQLVDMTFTRDQIANFKLKTGSKQGVTKVKIIAQSGKYTSVHELNVPIRVANPPTLLVDQVILQPKETKNIPIQPIGMAGTSTISLETSTVPELNLKSRIDELIAYPHGCLEQTTSALFPQIYLADLTTLSLEDKSSIDKNLKTGFEKFKSYQSTRGGFSYWPNTGLYDDYATSYAVHFMTEAKMKGYQGNPTLLSASIETMYKLASNYQPQRGVASENDFQTTFQAYRLMVLAIAGKPNLGAMNRLKEYGLNASARIRLALAYSYVGKSEVSKDLLAKLPTEMIPYVDDKYTYGSQNLDNAFLLELFIRLGDKSKSYTFFRKNVTTLNSRSYLGTQVTAMLMKSIVSYLAKNKIEPIDIKGVFQGKSIVFQGNKPIYTSPLQPVVGTLSLTNNSSSVSVVNIVRKGIEKQVKPVANKFLVVSIEYLDKSGNKILPDKMARQTDFKQVIKVKNTSNIPLNNLALTNYIPAGWEVINTRIGGAENAAGLDYQDVRDDAILSYFSIGAAETKIITQDFNASYEGSYIAPAILLESMYHPSYRTVLGSYRTIVNR